MPDDDEHGMWLTPEECVWEAPPGVKMTTRYSFVERYSHFFPDFQTNKALLHEIFVRTLEVDPMAGWGDLVDELRALSKNESTDFDKISKIYECLAAMDPIAFSKKRLRLVR